jgi:hypothetical protein
METTTRKAAQPKPEPATRPERVTVWCVQHFLDGDLHSQSFHLGRKDAELAQQRWNKEGRRHERAAAEEGERTADVFKLSVPASPQGIVTALARVEDIRFAINSGDTPPKGR